MQAYQAAILPHQGQNHWPMKNIPLDPPEVKVGARKVRRNRRRDLHKDPKKPTKLTRHGKEMMYTTYHKLGHNKRTCPDKDKKSNAPTVPKRKRGRPRKNTETFNSTGEVTTRIRGRGKRNREGDRGRRVK